jgi:Zn-finger nucleic acid-binding protein
VECGTEGHPRLNHAVPGELDELGLVPQQLQAAGQARLGGRTVENKIIVTGSVIGMHQVDIQRSGQCRSCWIDVDELEPVEREAPQQGSEAAAYHAGTEHRDPVADPRPRIPERIDSCLDGTGQHRTVARNSVWYWGEGACRDYIAILVGVQAEHAVIL